MKRPSLLAIIVALVLVALLAVYMFSFTVRFNEVAVRTTFGSVETVDADGSGSIITDAGLHFRWPAPIQSVETYPTTLQLLERPPTEVQTVDQYSVVVRMYVTWRIDDPLAFFRANRYIATAEQRIQAAMSEASAVISQYRFSDLVNSDENQVRLPEIEAKCLEQIRASLDASQVDLGITVDSFGIRRLLFPEAISEKVYQRMVATREALAANTREEGQTRARDIRNKAEQIASRIEEFARSQAADIRAEGERIATMELDAFKENPELASFLLQVETLKQVLQAGRNTFVLDARYLEALDLLIENKPPQPQPVANPQ